MTLSSRTKKNLFYIIIGLISFLILFFSLYSFISANSEEIVKQMKVIAWWVLILLFAYPVVKAFIWALLQKWIFFYNKIDFPFFKLFFIFSIANFFTIITPFGIGGEAIKMLLISKNKGSVSKSLPSIVTLNLIYQITNVLVLLFTFFFFIIYPSFFTALFNYSKDNLTNKFAILVIIFIVVGTTLQIFWGFCLLLISINGKFQTKILRIVHWFTVKIFKNIKLAKINEQKMSNTFKILRNDFLKQWNKIWLLLPCFFGILLFLVYQASLSFIVIKSISSVSDVSFDKLNILEVLIVSIMVEVGNAFIPIPGASGTLDLSFVYLMNNLLHLSSSEGNNISPKIIESISTTTLIFVRIAITFSVIAWGILICILIYIFKWPLKFNEKINSVFSNLDEQLLTHEELLDKT